MPNRRRSRFRLSVGLRRQHVFIELDTRLIWWEDLKRWIRSEWRQIKRNTKMGRHENLSNATSEIEYDWDMPQSLIADVMRGARWGVEQDRLWLDEDEVKI